VASHNKLRSTILAGALIVFGIILLARDFFGFSLEPWLGPVVLIGLGILGLLFPAEWARWRADRDARRAERHNR
jgi:hypothetical protein